MDESLRKQILYLLPEGPGDKDDMKCYDGTTMEVSSMVIT